MVFGVVFLGVYSNTKERKIRALSSSIIINHFSSAMWPNMKSIRGPQEESPEIIIVYMALSLPSTRALCYRTRFSGPPAQSLSVQLRQVADLDR